MSIFYLDYAGGNDSNNGVSPLKADFTSGGLYEPPVGSVLTGQTSGKTATIISFTLTSGSWADGDAAGTFHVYGASGAFTPGETLNVGANLDVATLTADFVSNAWKSLTTGATAARIAPGDQIRIKKHSDPVSLGSVSLTFAATTVQLPTVRWKMVNDGNTAWVGSTNVTASVSTSSMYSFTGHSTFLAIASGFTTGKIAYRDFGAGTELDLSAYTKLSMWVAVTTDLPANTLRLDLCSDALGDVPIVQLVLTKRLNYDSIAELWNFCILQHSAALPSSVRSISIHALSDPGTVSVVLENLIATNDINHMSLVADSDDEWQPLKSFASDGRTFTFWPGAGWMGATATRTLYATVDSTEHDAAVSYNTAVDTLNEGGAVDSPLVLAGGYDFSTLLQNGYTNISSTKLQAGYYLSSSFVSYVRIENVRFSNFRCAIVHDDYCQAWQLKNTHYTRMGAGPFGGTKGLDCSLIEGVFKVINSPAVNLRAFPFVTGYNPGALVLADITLCDVPSTGVSAAIYFYGSSWDIVGTLTSRVTSQYGIAFDCSSAFVRKIVTANNYIVSAKQGNIEIDRIVYTGSMVCSALSDTISSQYGAGSLHVGRVDFSYALNPIGVNLQAVGMHNRVSIDCLNGDPDKFIGGSTGGTWGDHITMGYAANWAYEGSGVSLVFNPTHTLYFLFYDIWLPVPAAGNYKLSMQVRKSSVAANCTMKYALVGCDITPQDDVSVPLTYDWAEFQSATVTAARKGMLRLTLQMRDGATSGDIGLDRVRMVKV